jgi:hypothetical protein
VLNKDLLLVGQVAHWRSLRAAYVLLVPARLREVSPDTIDALDTIVQ